MFGDVELLYHMVLEGFITDEGETKGQEDAQAFDEATTISDPVQYTVDIAIDSIQGQIELPTDLNLYLVRELVWTTVTILCSEHTPLIFRNLTKLKVGVLQP